MYVMAALTKGLPSTCILLEKIRKKKKYSIDKKDQHLIQRIIPKMFVSLFEPNLRPKANWNSCWRHGRVGSNCAENLFAYELSCVAFHVIARWSPSARSFASVKTSCRQEPVKYCAALWNFRQSEGESFRRRRHKIFITGSNTNAIGREEGRRGDCQQM